MILLTRKRKELGFSQSKLAQVADLHPSTISNIETGNLKPWKGQKKKIETAMRKAGWDGKGDLFSEVDE